ncbi:uncharacterized protein A4U43_C01F420 [Asparagus officinalis]|uniref:Photolyase/cryptochrome alpha/beta domain-containing protein n=1 Tax=Asparagus officinalis TaxID=4686 RepID=A0A5P1FQC8_ASPOF|nr:uncharacterized protein A4U43_C01F420 [Asparagus officinalis]
MPPPVVVNLAPAALRLSPRRLTPVRVSLPSPAATLRAKFLMECLSDLKKSLIKRGLNLLIQNGKPEDVLPSLAKQFGAHTVFAHKETCSEELLVEKLVIKGLQQVVMNNSSPKLQLVWGGATMYHVDDLPFTPQSIPDVYTQFRKSVESKCSVRSCCKLPVALGPLPRREMEEFGGWVTVPSLEDLGLHDSKCDRGMLFVGGESAALGRVYEYFWKKDLLRVLGSLLDVFLQDMSMKR